MAEYIERQKLYNNLVLLAKYETGERQQGILGCAETVRIFPAADVDLVVHGRWYMLDDCANAGVYCSDCGRRVHREEFAYKKLRSKYCPHCGAKMDGGMNGGH